MFIDHTVSYDQAVSRPKNVVYGVKRLLVSNMEDPMTKQAVNQLPFSMLPGDDDAPIVAVNVQV
jgi:molecular chaperone DnaK (HSP70)